MTRAPANRSKRGKYPMTVEKLPPRGMWVLGDVSEHSQQTDDPVAKLCESLDNRIVRGQTKLGEHYRRGKLAFHVHCVGKRSSCRVCIVIWNELDVQSTGEFVSDERLRHSGGDEQGAMFVPIVQTLEDGRQAFLPPLGRDLIRLQPLDQCLCVRGEALYFSLKTSDLVWFLGPVYLDGKLCPSVPLATGELCGEMVEGGTHLMNGFSGDNLQWVGDDDAAQCLAQLRDRVRIVLGDNSFWYRSDDVLNALFDVQDVFCGPM